MTTTHRQSLRPALVIILIGCLASPLIARVDRAFAQAAQRNSGDGIDLSELNGPQSEVRGMIERFSIDRVNLNRSYPADVPAIRDARMKKLYSDWLAALGRLNFATLSHDGQVDYILFKNHLTHELTQADIDAKSRVEMEPLMPFARNINELAEARRRMEKIEPSKIAAQLTAVAKDIEATRRAVEAGLRPEGRSENRPEPAAEAVHPIKVKRTVANRATAGLNGLRNSLRNWFAFYNGYDPVFTWWVDEPYKAVDLALANYATFLSERVVGMRPATGPSAIATTDARPAGERGGRFAGGQGGAGQAGGQGGGNRSAGARAGDSSDIIGDPIGRDALMVELANEMIPYTPEELIAIANKEMAFCDAEMVKASRELGYGDDWHKALEHVKSLYVEPGKQPELIRDLALEAIKFLDDHDLVTVPQMARETWRMDMMTPERQLVNPFFTGGETISVSYPTNTMSHEQKMMSMRGNNIHFSRATVFHELIPGHHLQGFMTARYKPYRGIFSTPFWGEGWALYWELLLWDMKFARSPEDRIGMLFWRMHRCARIIFSLSFHLEQMTPRQCIDFLVQRVGHEVENATAEVRRSFDGSYSPLYQAAYLLGGLQLHALHKELVDSGKMTNRAFHDAVLKENRIPIEMVRAILTKQKLGPDYKSTWRFYGPV